MSLVISNQKMCPPQNCSSKELGAVYARLLNFQKANPQYKNLKSFQSKLAEIRKTIEAVNFAPSKRFK